jgi:glutamyl-tRNA synthetase/nondiscriminating glutamyl-tRNA synthetase
VFDVEKLAWVNRHYLKQAQPERLALDAERHLREAGWLATSTPADRAYLEAILPAVSASLDRLDQLPARLRFLFDYSATRILESEAVGAELRASSVVQALADELAATPPMTDRDQFRAMAARVREKTGQKGKALFHPIRVVLTGEPEGLELDVAVPAIEQGARLAAGDTGLAPILSARARAEMLAAALR